MKGYIGKVFLDIKNERLPKEVLKYILKFNQEFDGAECVTNVYHSTGGYNGYEKVVHWDLNTIVKANLEIERVCNFIKNNNFSQMETLAFVHKYVSTVAKYNKSNQVDSCWSDYDQFFAGAYMKLPEVVCMGYASLMKEIIDNLNMPGLKCDLVSVDLERLDKDYKGQHARCFLKVEDKKYGINQTMFDDPTWDNIKDESSISKYAHFAMNNDCHFVDNNKKYNYKYPHLVKFSDDKSTKTITYEDAEDYTFNDSKNQVDQLMIETIHFNVLQKQFPNKSIDEIYETLNQMATKSFNEQEEREFVGNLKSGELCLSKAQAQTLFNTNRAKQQTNFVEKDNVL